MGPRCVVQSGRRKSVSRPSGEQHAHHVRAPRSVCTAEVSTGRKATAGTKQCSVHVLTSCPVSASIRKNAGIADRSVVTAITNGMIPSQMIFRVQPPPSDQ